MQTCLHIGTCGGCKSQQVPYLQQLKEKEELIKTLFAPHDIEPLVGSDALFAYRGKMEFTFSQDKKGEKYLGLVMPKSRGKVFSLTECLIAYPWMQVTVQAVQTFWKQSRLEAFFPPKGQGTLRTLTLRSSRDGKEKMVILTISGNPEYAPTKSEIEAFVDAVYQDEHTSVYLILQIAKKGEPTTFFEMHLKGPPVLKETLCGLTFHISPQSFFQPNVPVAEKMFQKAIAMLQLTGEEKVLDLYCGMGTIGMILAPHVRQVIGIEINPSSVADAKEALQRESLDNMHIYEGDVGTFLAPQKELFTPDIIIVDPPRTGLDQKAIKAINEIAPKRFLYISCNPLTQAENLTHFPHYQIQKIAPFDPFPHTKHLENIILLTKR